MNILQQISNVVKIRLEKNPISDEVVPYLKNLAYLEAVNLNETRRQ